MNEEKSLGQELIDAVDEALNSEGRGRTVRVAFDVKGLRKKLDLTQKEFSTLYHINLETLRNWEQEKRIPDLTSIAFLTCIEKNPVIIRSLLND
ncbi:Putative merR family bacterial regulatory protein [Legionella sainthelensi]|uniref:helix-turn-helix domain-containing protein n=1 Tax=Legionella sainthelensi TaxID=28087 RepID=UPI000F70D80B|nr:helix-turn-helix domain-containing protein [Legionella sainthelensi]VEB35388.1 Putative merR family bacterial regulatory protein [Legionella sainthelensi]